MAINLRAIKQKMPNIQNREQDGWSRVGMHDAAVLEIAARMQRLLRHHKWRKMQQQT